MPLKPVIYPYKMGSRSAKLLSSELNALRVHPDRNYRPYRTHLVVNWGNSHYPVWNYHAPNWINSPLSVSIASNKVEALEAMTEIVQIPEFTLNKTTAKQWINDGDKILCRTVLNGHSGAGIIVAQSVEQLVDCQLYTKLVPKGKEYRVHVFQGSIIDFCQKKKKTGVEDRQPYIRSHLNGWVFAREGVVLPNEVADEAAKAVEALRLDFGAVDIATKRDGGVVVFEVNTAPGIEGTTLRKYVEAIKGVCRGE